MSRTVTDTSAQPSKAVIESTRKQLIQAADLAHVIYPQYRNHWDGWILVEMLKRVRTKRGVAFEPHDYALVKPVPGTNRPFANDYHGDGKLFCTAYSSRNQIDTSVRQSDFRVL